ncbi:hypothetical protein D9M69_503580 [compost metagenome]
MKYSELPATTNGARAGVNCPAIAAALGTPAWASAWASCGPKPAGLPGANRPKVLAGAADPLKTGVRLW